MNEHTREPAPNPAERALRDSTVVGLAKHTILIAKGGAEHPIDDSAAPILGAGGETTGCVLTFRDVTERREFEKRDAVRLLEARLLASIVESSDDAIVRKSLNGIIQSWNAAAERLFGYPAAEAIGRHISLVIPPDRLSEEDEIISRLKRGERVEHFETVRMRRDGSPLQVSLTISPIHDAAGQVVAASKIVRDVTDRKRTEADREKFFTLVENSTDFIGICDADGVPIYVNPAGLRLVGLRSVDDPRGANVREFFFPEDQARVMDEFLPSVIAQRSRRDRRAVPQFRHRRGAVDGLQGPEACRSGRPRGRVRHRQPGRDRSPAARGSSSVAGGGSVRGRSAQE